MEKILEKEQVKKGYKKSAMGLIPNNWNLIKLEDLGTTFSGISGKSKEDFGFGRPYIPYKNIFFNSKVDVNYLDYVNIGTSENQNEVQYGDIFFTVSSESAKEVGMSSVLLKEINGLYLNSFCFGFRLNDFNILDPSFASYLLRGEKIRQKIVELAQGSTRFNLSKSGILKLSIIIPPLPEQQNIASILSTWDEAISNTKTLIEETKKRNKALAQQLLTGKTRLKGFEGKWEKLKISEFSNDISLKNKEDKDLIVLSCTKHHGLVPSLEYFGRKIYSENLDTYKIVERNCFAYATNHIEEGSIGYQDKYDSALISPMYTVFKTNEIINDEFLYKVLKSHAYIHEYQKRMEGSIDRRGGLRWDGFSKIKVSVPSLEEQKAINHILETANQELKTLYQKLKTLQEQKKGLMQKLLTGEIRVQIK